MLSSGPPNMMAAHAKARTLAFGLNEALRRVNGRVYKAIAPTPATVSTMTITATLNVQHVDSLNDVVAAISRGRLRETVPDDVLDAAPDAPAPAPLPDEEWCLPMKWYSGYDDTLYACEGLVVICFIGSGKPLANCGEALPWADEMTVMHMSPKCCH